MIDHHRYRPPASRPSPGRTLESCTQTGPSIALSSRNRRPKTTNTLNEPTDTLRPGAGSLKGKHIAGCKMGWSDRRRTRRGLKSVVTTALPARTGDGERSPRTKRNCGDRLPADSVVSERAGRSPRRFAGAQGGGGDVHTTSDDTLRLLTPTHRPPAPAHFPPQTRRITGPGPAISTRRASVTNHHRQRHVIGQKNYYLPLALRHTECWTAGNIE